MATNDQPSKKAPLFQRLDAALCQKKSWFVLLIVTLALGAIAAGLFTTFYVSCERNDLLFN